MKATARVRINKTIGNLITKGEEFDVYVYDFTKFAVADVDNVVLIHKEHCDVIPMMQYCNLKFRVTSEEQSEELQKYLFSLGVNWVGTSGTTPAYTHIPFLYVGPRGWLEYTDSEDVFNDLEAREYTLQMVTTVIPTLVAVEPRKTVLVGGQEVDEELVLAALARYGASKE